MGKKAVTKRGHQCEKWSDHGFDDDNDFPDTSVAAAHNYCRNPDGEYGPWCYTSGGGWGYCYIPNCEILTSTQTDSLKEVLQET